MRFIVALQSIQITGATCLTADAIYVKIKLLKTQRPEKPPCHIYNLCVQSRVCFTYSFKAKLVVLPITPSLRTLVAKYGSQIIELYPTQYPQA